MAQTPFGSGRLRQHTGHFHDAEEAALEADALTVDDALAQLTIINDIISAGMGGGDLDGMCRHAMASALRVLEANLGRSRVHDVYAVPAG